MEIMKINDAVTFGNYFMLVKNTPFSIRLGLTVPGGQYTEAVFNFDSPIR